MVVEWFGKQLPLNYISCFAPITSGTAETPSFRCLVGGSMVFIHSELRLRNSTGYYLANKGYDTRLIQDYLGHKNITHTVRYTRTAASRFENLWR